MDVADLRAALVAIQNEHPKSDHFAFGSYYCLTCLNDYPCNTRRLADDALTARTTKNGDA